MAETLSAPVTDAGEAARTGGRPVRVLSTEVPVPGEWTHLAGTFDLATDQLALYVDGRLQSTATNPSPANPMSSIAQVDGSGTTKREASNDRVFVAFNAISDPRSSVVPTAKMPTG